MIEAKIIADSINYHTKDRMTTFELNYPRFIHAEVMTHKMLAKNAQSSRAVPVASTLEVNKEWVKPIVWGKNKAGMSSADVLKDHDLYAAQLIWDSAAERAFDYSKRLSEIGLHKQWANRITEPFSNIKVIMSGTEYANFFWLRRDPDCAQPEIVELANQMHAAYEASKPEKLLAGEWHMPYIKTELDVYGERIFFDSNGDKLSIDDALQISASCCAQVSYRRLDDTKEKALEIYNKLFSGPKPHYSPTEHQGRVMRPVQPAGWEDGVSHMDRNGYFWSGNLKGFIQYRKLLEG